jgi:hypothetical protein
MAINSVFRVPVGLLVAWVMASPLTAQVPIDGVLLKIGSDVITSSDVRQARQLNLVEAPGGSDQAYVDALANRRLMLEELKRNPPAEPAPAAVDARQQRWVATLGPGVDLGALLSRAGMTMASARSWWRDDLRISAYLDQRFPASNDRERAIAAWVADLRQRVGIR